MTAGRSALSERVALDGDVVAFAARFVLAVANAVLGGLVVLAIVTAPVSGDALAWGVAMAALFTVTAVVFAVDARALYHGDTKGEGVLA